MTRIDEVREAVERIRDPGKFEDLASSILRRAEPRYKELIQTGLGPRGKPKRSPADAIIWDYPNGVLHGTLFEFTTAAGLRRKWLSDPDGDIPKSVRLFEEAKQAQPSAQFRLVVSSSSDPDSDLVTEAREAVGPEHDLDLWPLSRLADFLSNDPEGQWIASDQLGLPQRLVSRQLLGKLSLESKDQYWRQLHVSNGGHLISRSLDETLADELRDAPLRFLVGASGTGKSCASWRALDRHILEGGFGFWIPAEWIRPPIRPDYLIEQALRRLRPELAEGCGRRALRLLAEEEYVLLVVDDASRAANPTEVVVQVAALGRKPESGTSESASAGRGIPNWRIVCPLRTSLQESAGVARELVRTHSLSCDRFTEEEGVEALKHAAQLHGSELSSLEARRVSTALGNDPLLVGLATEHLHLASAVTAAADAIPRFIAESLEAIAQESIWLASELEEALLELGETMLRTDAVAPRWPELQTTIHGSVLDRLRCILRQRRICSLERSSGRLRFRHDRIRDYTLASSASRALAARRLTVEDLADPFYCEILGQALCLGAIDNEQLTDIVNANPIALFYSLRYFGTPTTQLQRQLLGLLTTWCRTSAAEPTLLHLRAWAEFVLSQTDSVHVPTLADALGGESWWLTLARLVNGDSDAAVSLHCRESPARNFPQIQEPVVVAARRGGAAFRDRLAKILVSSPPTSEWLAGALHVVGYIGDSWYEGAIAEAWKRARSRISPQLLGSFVWAGARCAGDDAARLLGPMFFRWRRLSEDRPPGRMAISEVNQVIQHSLDWAFSRHGIPERSLNFLVRQATGKLTWPVSQILSRLDHPNAMEKTVRVAATTKARYWFLDLEWSRPSRNAHSLSKKSKDRLKQLFASTKEADSVRAKAFRTWRASATRGDLDLLRGVNRDSSLFGPAVRRRAELGDLTVTPHFIDLLESAPNPDLLWRAADRIWTDEVEEALDRYYVAVGSSASADHRQGLHLHESVSLLARLPTRVAERLLSKHWQVLSDEPIGVLTSLFVESDKARSMANRAIAEATEPASLFKYLWQRWGMWYRRPSIRVGLSQLRALEPHLQHVHDAGELEHLWRRCNSVGLYDWRREHLDSYIGAWKDPGENRVWSHMNREGAVAILERYVAGDRVEDDDRARIECRSWLEDFGLRGEPRTEWQSVLTHVLRSHRTQTALRLACHIVDADGKRDGLALLELVPATDAETRLLKARTDYNVRKGSPPL